jgi:hypothetical protein
MKATRVLLILGAIASAVGPLWAEEIVTPKGARGGRPVDVYEAHDGETKNFALPGKASVVCIHAQEKGGEETGRRYLRLPSGEFALKQREYVNEPKAGGGTLRCNGTFPLYCQIYVTH